MKKKTRPWIRKADDDLTAAQRLASGAESLHDQVCFHCQQCAEKYLKAILEELGLHIPKTHDLDALLVLLLPHYATLRKHRRALTALTQFAVFTRYPGFLATKRNATSALKWAVRVRSDCRALLGLKA